MKKLVLVLAVMFSVVTNVSAEKIVFQDNTEVNINATRWLRSNNQMGGYKAILKDPEVDHTPYMNVGNRVMLHSCLEREITRDNSAGFRLKIKVLHKGDQRGAVVWLLDSNGNQGYGFLWDSAATGTGSHAAILKWDSPNQPAFQKYGTFLSKRIAIPGDEKKAPFAEFELTWIAATGKLTLKSLGSVHGPAAVSVIDKDFGDFSSSYLHGSDNFYDDIVVYQLSKPGEAAKVEKEKVIGRDNTKITAEDPAASPMAKYADIPLPKELGEIPQIKCPLYVMEYHIWYRAPFGVNSPGGYVHWPDREVIETETAGPDWVRRMNSIGYPLPGIYNAIDPGIIRWQLQTAANAGIDGLFVQMFPDRFEGTKLGGEETFEKMLDIASESGIKLGVNDEINFRIGWNAQKPDAFAKRAGDFVKKHGKHPAFLRINGMPVYSFQYWGGSRFKGKEVEALTRVEYLGQIMRGAEEIAGEPIFWITYTAFSPEIYAMLEAKGFVITANSNFIKGETKLKPVTRVLDWQGLTERCSPYKRATQQAPDKFVGLWGYPGFDSTSKHPNNPRVSGFSRRGGKSLVELLRMYVKEEPDFIMLSSWNDWQENTALEPGMAYDGYNGDPYLYCRILAATKGKTFVPAPLPPKESIDPLMLQPLYGIDRIPPKVVSSYFRPTEPSLVVTVADSASPVKRASVALRGDAYLKVEGGKLVEHGMKPVDLAEDNLTDEGLVLQPRKKLTITLDNDVLQGEKQEAFLGLEFTGDAKGRLYITYSSNPAFLDYREYDFNTHQIFAYINLDNGGEQKTAVRMLRSFDFKTRYKNIRLEYVPDRDVKEPGTVRISKLDFFRDASSAAEGLEISNAAEDSQVKTYYFKTPALDLDARLPTVYVFAEDKKGNRSAPVAVKTAEALR